LSSDRTRSSHGLAEIRMGKRTTRIRIGQIGICHEHAAAKMQTLRRLADTFEIVGVVDDRSTAVARFAGDDLTPYEDLTWMTEEELLNAPGLGAVIIETANDDLVPAALRCMRHNVSIHMDKPGGEDMAAFRRLLEGCRKRDLVFQMGYMFRNNPAMQFAARAVRDNWLGELFEFQADMSHNYGSEAYQAYIGRFQGGIMFNLACHLVDLIVSIMGRPENVVPFLKSAPGYGSAVRNNCLAVLEYPHALATLRACSKEIDGVNRRSMKISGTKGTIELSPLERFDGRPLQMRLVLLQGNSEYAAGSHVVDFGVTHDRYQDQLLEFAELVRGKGHNKYTYEHDELVQEVLLASCGLLKWKDATA
jgi:predicted dehydrogenase